MTVPLNASNWSTGCGAHEHLQAALAEFTAVAEALRATKAGPDEERTVD